jgi:hypothetical protein
MSRVADTVINIARQVKSADRIIEPFVPPQVAVLIEGANALEPTFEAAATLAESLFTQGADHTGAIASVGAIFVQLGQAFMTHGVLSPPPVTAPVPAGT